MEKFTKKDYHSFVITLVENAMENNIVSAEDGKIVIAKALAELKLLEKKKALDNKKKAEKSTEDKKIAEKILTVLANAESGMTVTDITHADMTILENCSNQKITSILKGLLEEGKVENNKVGKKSLYTISLSEDFPNEEPDDIE